MALIAALASAGTLLVTALVTRHLVRRREAARIARLEQSLREAREQANVDSLTALYNRRFFHDVLGRELARSQRYGRALALLVLDLDDFKSINDRLGHLAGDTVLAEASACVSEVVRTADVACRIGGDEFAVILPEATAVDADRIYRRLQEALAARRGPSGPLSASAGVAEAAASDDPTSFFRRADDALLQAKSSGKARIARSA